MAASRKTRCASSSRPTVSRERTRAFRGGLIAAWLCAGACATTPPPAAGVSKGTPPSDPGPRIEEVPGVDLAELTDVERQTWTDLVNAAPSPCGEPASVARCAQKADRCRSCGVAARYLRRLVMDGFDRDTLQEQYEGRFGRGGAVSISLDDARVRGAAQGRVTVVVFSDFQCPYCGQAHPLLARLLKAHRDRVRMVFKHYPLAGHPRAMPAARAAEAARLQGRFWEMHDHLFEHQDALEDADLERYAAVVGLDLPKFRADMSSAEVQARIDLDRAEGASLGIEGTPTLFIGGRRFRESLRTLETYLQEEVERDDIP